MKMKNVWMFLAVLMGALTWTSCSEDDDPAPVVGISAISVTPAGSAVSYNAAINGTTATVDIPWDVADAALAAATVNASPTYGSVVYYNDQPVGEGVEADFTAAVTLVAKGGDGTSVAYTVTVNRVEAGEDMVIKSSSFQGFPANVIDYNIAYFKGKFYAFVTSTTEEIQGEGEEAVTVKIEHYDLFSSADGINWTKVNYNVSTEGVTLPEGQDGYVVGGEGACLVVHNDRLYVLGGSRLKGQDIYGNPAEAEDWGWAVMEQISAWRSFSTADGQTFKCDTIGISVKNNGEDITANASWFLPAAHVNAVSFKGKIFVQGGLEPVMMQWQGAGRYFSISNDKDYEIVTPVGIEEGVTPDVKRRTLNAFFTFKDKMWCMGGFTNYLDPSNMANSIWSSEDGLAWKQEAEFPVDAEGNQVVGLTGIYDMTVVASDEVVYIFGGAINTADGNVVSNKIFKSTDCITWEEVADVPAAFSARRHTVGVAQGNSAWLFGGMLDAVNSGYYAYPLTEPFTPVTETWVKLMN